MEWTMNCVCRDGRSGRCGKHRLTAKSQFARLGIHKAAVIVLVAREQFWIFLEELLADLRAEEIIFAVMVDTAPVDLVDTRLAVRNRNQNNTPRKQRKSFVP